MRCERGLGWPVEETTVTSEYVPAEVLDREEIVAQLTELREELAPEWSERRGIWNFAILVAKGLVRKKKP